MDFRERLQKAANRGLRSRSEREQAEAAEALSEEECRRMHAAHRRELTDHIEKCLEQLGDNFPGFQFSSVMDEKGWGAAVTRDDLAMQAGKRNNLFSRLQILVGPYTDYKVLSISAKGAIRNKESFVRNHFAPLAEIDIDRFHEIIEQWVLDYAELYAAS